MIEIGNDGYLHLKKRDMAVIQVGFGVEFPFVDRLIAKE